MEPIYQDHYVTLYNADALDVMVHLANEGTMVQAIVTDPPYSSGGLLRSDRMQNVVTKYEQSGTKRSLPTFQGDNRDQRGYFAWSHLWMSLARQVTEPSGNLFSFIDWRQMPTLSDAIQSAGWTWQGVGVWNKGYGRPNKGRFSAGHELVLHGVNGNRTMRDLYAPAVFQQSTPRDKVHLSQKPVEVMHWILSLVEDRSTILDPFVGSGTTLVAAKQRGIRAIGIEADHQHLQNIIRRCEQTAPATTLEG